MTSRFFSLPALALLVISCGSDGGAQPPAPTTDAGADSNAPIDTAPAVDAGLAPAIRASAWPTLSDADKRVACDFFAAVAGGYGLPRPCPDGTSTGSLFQSQGECLAAMTSCTAQVTAIAACHEARVQHGCAEDLPDECQDLTGTCL